MGKAIMIFESKDKIVTSPVTVDKNIHKVRHAGRKAVKMIVLPEDCNTKKKVLKLKECINPSGLIICTNGEPVYDGRKRNSIS